MLLPPLYDLILHSTPTTATSPGFRHVPYDRLPECEPMPFAYLLNRQNKWMMTMMWLAQERCPENWPCLNESIRFTLLHSWNWDAEADNRLWNSVNTKRRAGCRGFWGHKEAEAMSKQNQLNKQMIIQRRDWRVDCCLGRVWKSRKETSWVPMMAGNWSTSDVVGILTWPSHNYES